MLRYNPTRKSITRRVRVARRVFGFFCLDHPKNVSDEMLIVSSTEPATSQVNE